MRLPSHLDKKRWVGSRRTWLVILVSLLLLGAGTAWFLLGGIGSPILNASAQSTPAYQTATARRADLRISISGAGTLVANRSADLSFSTSGSLVELNVDVGETVTAGQTLARLGNLETLEANVASARLQYLKMQKELSDLQQNGAVALAQAYRDWVTARASYEDALYKYQRTAYARCSQEVNTRNAAALDWAKSKLDSLPVGSNEWIDAQNNYETALANYNYCIAYSRDEKTEAKAALELADVSMKQAELKYNKLQSSSGIDPDELALAEAKVKETETQLAQAEKELEGSVLIAPFTGVITYLAASEGAIVNANTFLAISDVSRLYVKVQVDETDLNKFAVGNQAEIVFDALPDQVFTGKIVQVEPQLVSEDQVRLAQGLIELDPDHLKTLQSFPLGLNAAVEIIDQEAKNALVVPIEALRDLGDGEYAVFVLESDNSLRLRAVEVGLVDTARAEIVSGLNEGDVVSTGMLPTSK